MTYARECTMRAATKTPRRVSLAKYIEGERSGVVRPDGVA
jgi:hypothetical protein